MTARLIDRGTTTRTATAIAEELDFLGARLDASAGGTGSTVSLSLLAKDIDRGLDLFADILQNSRFETAELERERASMLSQIQQRQVNPRQVVSEVFREGLYGEHPLHRPISGYAATVAQITRDDVLDFYQRFKWSVVTELPRKNWTLASRDIDEALQRIRNREALAGGLP